MGNLRGNSDPAWTWLPMAKKAELLRPLIEGEGMTALEAAKQLSAQFPGGVTRSAVLGVMRRAKIQSKNAPSGGGWNKVKARRARDKVPKAKPPTTPRRKGQKINRSKLTGAIVSGPTLPPKPVPIATLESPRLVRFVDRTMQQCCFIADDVAKTPIDELMVCGKPVHQPNAPYCGPHDRACHSGLVYNPSRGRVVSA